MTQMGKHELSFDEFSRVMLTTIPLLQYVLEKYDLLCSNVHLLP